MPGEKGEAKLKLIHLVWGLILAAVLVGIAIGAMQNQQANNTKAIGCKLEKDIFEQHQSQQIRSMDKIDKSMDSMDKKLDRLLEK